MFMDLYSFIQDNPKMDCETFPAHIIKGKEGNALPVHAMKAYMGSRDTAALILNHHTRWR